MKNQSKDKLKQNSVDSDGIHVGIELELYAPCEGAGEHDDAACADNYRDSFGSVRSILQDHFGLDRSNATRLEDYFDYERFIEDAVSDFSCDDDECGYRTQSGDSKREEIECDLKKLTGNESFKVVEDGSLRPSSDQIDAEVCWNYFISPETQKDNLKIMEYLKDNEFSFDTNCGLHINLNNYLKLKQDNSIDTSHLDFLFNFVAPSRRDSQYCTRYAISPDSKYSMIFNQDDRFEFRFFSPTLEANKLNHYVRLAHHIYKRLAGIDCKLPKKTESYFREKMLTINYLSQDIVDNTIALTNAIDSLKNLEAAQKKAREVTEIIDNNCGGCGTCSSFD